MDLHIAIIGRHNLHLLDCVAEEVFDNPVDPARLSAYIADPSQRLMVALAGGRVIGQLKAALHRHPDKAPAMFVEELGVGRLYRRQGIGTALMRAAVTLARNLGCTEMWLATEPENEAANAFYRAIGMDGQHVVMYSRQL